MILAKALSINTINRNCALKNYTASILTLR